MFVLMLDRGFSLDSFGVDGSRLRVSLGTVGSSNFHFARWSADVLGVFVHGDLMVSMGFGGFSDLSEALIASSMWSAFASGYDPVIVSHDGSVELGGVEIIERKRARPSVLDGMGVASGRVLGCSWTHQIAHRWHEHGGRGQDPAHIGRARRLLGQMAGQGGIASSAGASSDGANETSCTSQGERHLVDSPCTLR